MNVDVHHPKINISIIDHHDGIEPEFTEFRLFMHEHGIITIYFNDIKEIETFSDDIVEQILDVNERALR